jgi:hypothetical protein
MRDENGKKIELEQVCSYIGIATARRNQLCRVTHTGLHGFVVSVVFADGFTFGTAGHGLAVCEDQDEARDELKELARLDEASAQQEEEQLLAA